ncbi:hypothetical protein ACQRIT_002742 [Beauveria bassiana]|uniref:Enoyl-CoA hydratase n=3 Tax=Beauveria bassiana TaxID=176275 RepID=J4KQL7_BEAB2|nr:enoyl-CoA hydratase [Beauveria bassiana ARSEF 2860]KAF1737226.1 3-hydroxypropionyl-coenzyme A dehydratase [Beauveria bassiana]KGQ10744.1 3-hydroxypropionyl-coenzyme A dehydratase [Beauveria bassiana D1-5]EJP69424.1 enoyl-CoA hydratase [Beauveria bassiana ARSEF 2860]KAH8718230.1 3-hydroxypropionyl-coenzyme A dehydratase [Beauveria bassiana]PQK10528.1 hypothetical protein BB8028_0002g08490 [Beauveria bassiana]
MAPSFPDSYNTLSLPDISLSHHPESSPTVTPVIIVRLNRPESRHAYTDTMGASLVTAYGLLSEDPRVRAIVLTSADATNKFFCAGMDFNVTAQRVEDPLQYRDSGGTVSIAMHRCQKPIVAAVNGSAVGIGMTMTLPATVRVASSQAKCGFVFAQRGFCMEACSSFFLPRLIGTSKAMHLVSTGAVYPATHRLFDDLFSEVVEPAQVLPTALKIAEGMAQNCSIVSTQVMKDMMYSGPKSPEEAHLLESKIFYSLTCPDTDSAEGVQSFLQKRPPKFTGTMQNQRPFGYPWWSNLDVRPKI